MFQIWVKYSSQNSIEMDGVWEVATCATGKVKKRKSEAFVGGVGSNCSIVCLNKESKQLPKQLNTASLNPYTIEKAAIKWKMLFGHWCLWPTLCLN